MLKIELMDIKHVAQLLANNVFFSIKATGGLNPRPTSLAVFGCSNEGLEERILDWGSRILG